MPKQMNPNNPYDIESNVWLKLLKDSPTYGKKGSVMEFGPVAARQLLIDGRAEIVDEPTTKTRKKPSNKAMSAKG